jgi:hypothetical protein
MVAECMCIDALINNLNSVFFTDLSSEYSSSRSSIHAEEESTGLCNARFVVCGASHANRLANALDDLELQVKDISCPGCTVTEANVKKMSAQLQEVLAEEWDGPTYIIYYLFDNSVFMAVGDGGGRSLPVKSRHDGQYHVLGDMSCATRQEFKVLFSTTLPLLRAGGQHHKVLLSPLLWYIGAPCCSLAGHVTKPG